MVPGPGQPQTCSEACFFSDQAVLRGLGDVRTVRLPITQPKSATHRPEAPGGSSSQPNWNCVWDSVTHETSPGSFLGTRVCVRLAAAPETARASQTPRGVCGATWLLSRGADRKPGFLLGCQTTDRDDRP